MLKQDIIKRMQEYFENDRERIEHALKVTNYAEKLIKLHNSDSINKEIIIYRVCRKME
jgi:HD superfamily phosphohydrolase YqeK